MHTVCRKDMCTGCMACIDKCAFGALKLEQNYNTYNVSIQDDKCVNCGACHRICHNNTEDEFKEPIGWLEGWANDSETRKNSSSGGFATAMMKGFIKNGGVVCSCVFEKGDFIFKSIRNVSELSSFQGSKYVKSNPMGIYKEIESLLKDKRVLFIGLPCQVAALKNYIPENNLKNLYTVDLICHGTPSPLLLRKFLKEHGYDINSITEIRFRRKTNFRLMDDKWEPIVDSCIADCFSYSFLHGFNYTENCYSCKYARRQRISDLTIGDSWGTDKKEEKRKGISLALVQTEKGNELLELSELALYEADASKAVAANHQLESPSVKDKRYVRFFEAVNKGIKYDKAVLYATPYGVLKQNVKKILMTINKNLGRGGYRIEVKREG